MTGDRRQAGQTSRCWNKPAGVYQVYHIISILLSVTRYYRQRLRQHEDRGSRRSQLASYDAGRDAASPSGSPLGPRRLRLIAGMSQRARKGGWGLRVVGGWWLAGVAFSRWLVCFFSLSLVAGGFSSAASYRSYIEGLEGLSWSLSWPSALLLLPYTKHLKKHTSSHDEALARCRRARRPRRLCADIHRVQPPQAE